jgi:hypothetical protein
MRCAHTNGKSLPAPAQPSLDASGGSAFLDSLGPARVALMRADASTQPLGVFNFIMSRECFYAGRGLIRALGCFAVASRGTIRLMK